MLDSRKAQKSFAHQPARRNQTPFRWLQKIAQGASDFVAAMEWYPFNEDEKRDILKAWNIIDPVKQNVAMDIYEMIFNQCPEARRLFPKMKFHGSKPDKKQCEFSFQAMRFMQVIEGAVLALDHLHTLDPILDNLGRRHGKLEVNGKFRSYYWSTFLECTIYNFRKTLTGARKFPDNEIDNATILWRLLLRDVMKKIKNGTSADIAHRVSQMQIENNSRKISNISLPSIRKDSGATSEGTFDDIL